VFVLAAVLGGGFTWHYVDQRRKGEAARDQVMTALRITNHALDQIQARLAARDRADHE
jgi:predicted type IV restriction endonuclease